MTASHYALHNLGAARSYCKRCVLAQVASKRPISSVRAAACKALRAHQRMPGHTLTHLYTAAIVFALRAH
jgi:hypothetical protein